MSQSGLLMDSHPGIAYGSVIFPLMEKHRTIKKNLRKQVEDGVYQVKLN